MALAAWRGKVRVTYINGIRTGERECREHAEHIGALFASPCYAFWNKTAGALSDLSQAALQKVFSADTEEVRQLAKHLSTHLDAMGGDGLLVHIAHSQGALITSLCRRHLTVAQRARIHVIVLGGAASISDREFGSAVNYYCTNEPMLYIDSRASRAWRLLESRSAQPRARGGDAAPLASAATARNQAQKSTDKEVHARAADSDKPAEAISRQAAPGAAVAEGVWRRLLAVGPGRGAASHSDQQHAQSLQGAVGVDFEGARFTFLRPVHRDRFGIEDHLITNEAYLRALRFEANEFRQRYLWFWQRLRWNYFQPLSHRAPASTEPGAGSGPPGIMRWGSTNPGAHTSAQSLHTPATAFKEGQGTGAHGVDRAGGTGLAARESEGASDVPGEEGWAQHVLGASWIRRVFPRMGTHTNSSTACLQEPSAPPGDARHAAGAVREAGDKERVARVEMEGANDKAESVSHRQQDGKSWWEDLKSGLRAMRHGEHTPPSDLEPGDAAASEQEPPPAHPAHPAPVDSVSKSGGKPNPGTGNSAACTVSERVAGRACPPTSAAVDGAETPGARLPLQRSRL